MRGGLNCVDHYVGKRSTQELAIADDRSVFPSHPKLYPQPLVLQQRLEVFDDLP